MAQGDKAVRRSQAWFRKGWSCFQGMNHIKPVRCNQMQPMGLHDVPILGHEHAEPQGQPRLATWEVQ